MNLFEFLNSYSICPSCGDKLLSEIIVVFNINDNFKLYVDYINACDDKSRFKYIKFTDDDDRKNNQGFERSPDKFHISNSGKIITSNDLYSIDSYVVYVYCQSKYWLNTNYHFSLETQTVHKNGDVKIYKEELKVKNYRIINNYEINKTKVYIDDISSIRLQINLMPLLNKSKYQVNQIISKIESLLVLT